MVDHFVYGSVGSLSYRHSLQKITKNKLQKSLASLFHTQLTINLHAIAHRHSKARQVAKHWFKKKNYFGPQVAKNHITKESNLTASLQRVYLHDPLNSIKIKI